VFGHQQDRTAPLTADGKALDEAENDQQGGGPVADVVVPGQAAHEEGRDTHEDDGHLQGVLSAQPVADVAEDDAAERPGDEADRVGQEGGDDAVELAAGVGEEELAENEARRGGVEEELVPFHDRAHH
jgi:hypothetical protein